MFKSKKVKDTVRRAAALTLAFLMVFQYTASGLSVYSWAEDGTETAVEESAAEKAEERFEKEETSEAEAEKPVQQEEQKKEEAPKQPEEKQEESPAEKPVAEQKQEEPEQKTEESEKQDVPQDTTAEEQKDEGEKKEDEVEYPEQSFTRTVSGVTVRIQAPEGALPENSDVRITPVKAGTVQKTILNTTGDEVKVIKAMDITFVDKDGGDIEPEKTVLVNFEYEKFGSIVSPTVYHIDDEGQAEKLPEKKIGVYNDQVSINTQDFSIYAVVEEGETHEDSRLLVRFIKPDSSADGQLIDDMYVKKDDNMEQVLYDPGVGTLDDGVYFKGWTTEKNYTSSTNAMTISDVRDAAVTQLNQGIAEGETITYYAMLFKRYRITYFDVNDISLGEEEVAFRADSTETRQRYTVNMAYTVQDDTHHFEGWNVREGGSYIADHTTGKTYHNNDVITITGDVQFGVNAPEGHWFIFDENGKGATYNAPQFIQSDQTPTRPNDAKMIRNGYTFGGWFKDKAVADQTSGGTQYNFSQTLTDKTTVYARWIPKTTAGYTIIIWKQNLSGDGYDFEEAITKTGNVGSTVNDVRYQNGNLQVRRNGNQWSTVSYTGFHYKEYDQNVTIKTEGNSVVNIYFDRNEHTLTFQDHPYNVTTSGNGTQYALIDGQYVQLTRYGNNNYWYNGQRYYGTRYTQGNGWTTVKTITALYQQSIGGNFPIVGNNGATYDHGERWDPQSNNVGLDEVLVYLDVMPAGNVVFHLDTADRPLKTINWYVEALPDDTGTVTAPNRLYDYDNNAVNAPAGKRYKLYNTVSARYNGVSKEDFIEIVGFNRLGADSQRDNSGFYIYSTTQNGTINFYYTRNTYEINLMDGAYVNGDGNPVEGQSGMGQIGEETGISYGADVSSYNDFEPETTPSGFVFEGWYLDSACTHPYTFDKMSEGGITVYAKWRQKQYRVFLHVNYPDGATGNINWGTTSQAMNFRVSEGGHVSEPTGRDLAGYDFVGWYLDEACTQVFNGEAYTINEDTVTTDYDKAVDMTDTYDNNGFLKDPKSNSDVGRFWITKKLDIYARWRATLEGASGIVVEYDAGEGGTGAPTDTNTYVDGALAPAGKASRPPAGSHKVFGYWQVQKWENGTWADTEVKVNPGDKFTVLAKNAKVEDLPSPGASGETKKYTVKLKAVYIDTEKPTPTHIYWYKNTGEDAFQKDNDLEINKGVEIPAAPERAGYKFLGWARVKISESTDPATAAAEAAAWEADTANWTQELDDDSVYIQYDDGTYKTKDDDNRSVTHVAADEELPYHAMFAVWKEKLEIRITGATGIEKYTGSEQSVSGHTVEYKRGTDTEWSTTAPHGVSVVLKTEGSDTAKGTEVGEYLMGLTADKFNIHTGKYAFDPVHDLTITDGKLTITEESVKIRIIGNTKTETYNGSEQSVTGYKVEYMVGDEGDWTETAPAGITVALKSGETAEAARTDAGTTQMGLSADKFDISAANYAFDASTDLTITDGNITVDPKQVTITTGSDSKEYDGTPLTNSTASITGLVEGETATVTATGSQTNVGSSSNTYSIDWGATNKDNYTIQESLGTLTVTANTAEVKLTAASDSKTYDGTELTNNTVTVSGLPEGFTVTWIFAPATGSQTDAGSSGNVVNENYAIIRIADQQNVTAWFTNVKKVNGTLTVNKATVTITTGGGEKPYDGTALTNSEASITGLVNNETATVTATGSQTEVGQSDNTYSITWGTAKADNYTISESLGKLKVTKNDVSVVLTAPSDTKTYDGTALTCDGTGEKKVTASGLPEGFTVEATATGSQTDAGESANAVNDGYVIKNAAGEDKTANFTNITTVDGKLTVNPAPVTITTGSDSKAYDGTALTNGEASIAGLVNNETAAVTATGSQTEVGSSSNTYSIDWGTTNKDNYAVTENLGTLTVTESSVEVTLTAPSDSKTYDGTALTCDGTGEKKVTASGLPTGFTVEATASGSQTDAGESANVVNDGYVIKNAAGIDKTANFSNIKKVDGTLTVNPAPVTITTGSDSKAYDGTALTKDEAGITGLVNNETATVTATGSQTEVGSSSNTYSIDWGTTNKDNYTVTENLGTLTVTENNAEVTLTAPSDSKTYDGTALTCDGTGEKKVTASRLPEGFTVEATASGSQTDAGTSDNIVNDGYVIKNAEGEDKTANFTNVKKEKGTLTVEPKPITITTGSGSKQYDGTPLTKKDGYTVDGIVSRETYGFEVTGTITEVGTTSNTYTITWAAEGNSYTAKSENYTISDNLGTLTITENSKEVTLTAASDRKDYDGTPLTNSNVKAEGLPNGFTVVATASGSQTNAGSSDNTVNTDYVIKNAAGEDKTANFTNVKLVNGTLTVDPINVTVTIIGANNTTDYDGAEHTVSGYTATADSDLYDVTKDFTFTHAEGADLDVDGKIRAKRTDAGTTYMGLAPEQFVNMNSNFSEVEFVVTDGYQTITPIDVTVTITGHNNTTDYDGAEHSVSGYDVEISNPLYTQADFSFTGLAEAKRTNAGTTNMGLAASQFANRSTNFRTVTFNVTDGYQTIDPIDVTVTIIGANNTADYDGEEHTVAGYTATASTNLYDVENDFTFSGTAEAKRTDAGTTNMGLKAEQFTNTNTNFGTVTFEVTDGYQTITPIDVTVTIVGANNTSPYDGEEHEVTGYTATASTDLYDVTKDFTFRGTAEAKRTDVGTTNMNLTAGQFANTNTNFGTVTFNVTDGYQTIDPLNVTVTITGHNNTATYDGEEHSVSGYDVEISNPLYKEADFTFSGTAAASRTDVGTTNMGLKAEQFTNTNTNFGTVTFNVTDGYQTITPVDEVVVTITGHNNTADYDSEEHSVSGYDVQISDPLYKASYFTFSGTAEAKRTDAGTTNMGLAASQFTNNNENFDKVTFNVTDGYQTIDPIDVTVTITGHNNTADYDGEEHSVSGYDVLISSPLYKEADFTFSGTAAAARTDVGTTNMGLASSQFTNNNSNFGTVTFNVTDGYQTINPIDVTVTIVGANNTTDYDGEEHKVSGYTATASTELYDVTKDFTFSGTAEAKRTDAGTTNMGLKAEQFTNKNTNFGTVTFNVTDGYQTINPIDVIVTIVGANNTTAYDGVEHAVSGYTATANSELYDVTKDFTFSGTAEAKRTDAGTTYMGLAASQFTNTNANFGTVTFNVTDGYQTINPIDVIVTIVGANNTTAYDGVEHAVSGYTATANSELYDVTKDFTFSGTAEAKRTDAGTANMGLAADQFKNTNTNFRTVTFEVTDGYQTITPIDVTVTIVGANNTSPYDGEEHEVTGYTATASTDLYDVTKDFTFSGTAEAKRTDVGTTNMNLTAGQFANTNTNFSTVTFNVTDGYQTITPINVTVTITGHHNATTYDGEEHSVSGYDVEISNPLYKETDFTFSGTAEAARTDAGTTNMGLKAEQFTNTNTNFGTVTFNVTDGYQTITEKGQVVVTITGHNNTADYDGKEHSVSGYDVQISDPLYKESDFTFSGTSEAARTDAGTTNMGLKPEQFVNTNANFKDVTFKVTDGYQTINKIGVTVTITENGDEVDYDGEKHTVSGYDVSISNKLYKESDFTFSGTDSVSGTNAGTYDMELKPEDFTNTNGNFENVSFVIVDGQLVIKPIDVTVTITEHSDEVDYDGKEHTVTGYDVEISNPLYTENDFTFSGTASVSGTNAGTYDMELKPEDFTNTNNNFANVTFTIVDGQLVIKPVDVTVTITEHSDEVDYDGKQHTVTGYDVEISNPLYTEDDFTFKGTASVSGTNAGTYDMGLKPEDFTNTNSNFANVTFTIVDGQLVIKPVDVTVTITGANNTSPYDGAEHTVNGYTATANSSLYDVTKDFTFSGTASATRTDAGTTKMGLKADQFTNTNTNFANVTFEVTDGYQTIKAIDVTVTITEHSDEVDYDGEKHTVTGYDFSADSNLYKATDFTFSGTDSVSGTDAGKYDMELKPEDFTNTNNNFANVTFTIVDGQLVIKPIDVTVSITGHYNSTTYDENEHSVVGYDVEISNDLYKESDFTFTPAEDADLTEDGEIRAARTEIGTTDMGLKPEQFSNKNKNFKDVTFDVTDGYQTIVPIGEVVVTITGHNNTSVYDGSEHGVSGYDVEISDPLYKEEYITFSGRAVASRTDAGTTYMGLEPEQFGNTSDRFDQVTFVVNDGYQTITPRTITVTITGNSTEAVYDGNEHTAEGYKAVSDNDMFDVDKDIRFNGTAKVSRTDAGRSDMSLDPSQFSSANGNFDVRFVVAADGFVEISSKEITVTIKGNTAEHEYNGKEHSVEGYTVTISDSMYKESDIVFSGEAAAEGVNAGRYDMGLLPDQFTNSNDNFDVTFEVEDGSLTITRKTVKVTADDKQKYVGEKDPEFTAKVTGLAEGDPDSVISYRISRAKGEKAGKYNIVPSGAETQGNYTVVYVKGTLTIKENPVPPVPQDDDDDDDDNNNPGGGGGNPGVNPPAGPAAPQPAPAPAAPQDGPQDIDDPDTPLDPGETDIDDPDTPLGPAEPETANWALINLLCAIASVIVSAAVLILYLGKRKKEEDGGEQEQEIKKKGLLRLIDIIPAAAAVITFILTEDLSGDMVLTDQWTILMVVILLVDIAIAAFTKKSVKDADNTEESAESN